MFASSGGLVGVWGRYGGGSGRRRWVTIRLNPEKGNPEIPKQIETRPVGEASGRYRPADEGPSPAPLRVQCSA